MTFRKKVESEFGWMRGLLEDEQKASLLDVAGKAAALDVETDVPEKSGNSSLSGAHVTTALPSLGSVHDTLTAQARRAAMIQRNSIAGAIVTPSPLYADDADHPKDKDPLRYMIPGLRTEPVDAAERDHANNLAALEAERLDRNERVSAIIRRKKNNPWYNRFR